MTEIQSEFWYNNIFFWWGNCYHHIFVTLSFGCRGITVLVIGTTVTTLFGVGSGVCVPSKFEKSSFCI